MSFETPLSPLPLRYKTNNKKFLAKYYLNSNMVSFTTVSFNPHLNLLL